MSFTLKKFGDADCRRIEDHDGVVHAMVLRLANGQWCLSDRLGNRTSGAVKSDKAAFALWLDRVGLITGKL